MRERKKVRDILGEKVFLHEPINDRVREVMFLRKSFRIDLVLPVYHIDESRNPHLLVYQDIVPESFSYRGNPDNIHTFMGELPGRLRTEILNTNYSYRGYRIQLERAGFYFPGE